jgi:hypothetical protein
MGGDEQSQMMESRGHCGAGGRRGVLVAALVAVALGSSGCMRLGFERERLSSTDGEVDAPSDMGLHDAPDLSDAGVVSDADARLDGASLGEVGTVDLPPADHPAADLLAADLPGLDAKPDASSPPHHLWSRQLGGGSVDVVWAVAIDSTGNIYLAGELQGAADYGGGALASKGAQDIFLVSFDPQGKHRWSKSFGSAKADFAYGVAVGSSGDLYLAGRAGGPISFGGPVHANKGDYDIFLASFNAATGASKWSKTFGNTKQDYAEGLALDSSGNIYITGEFQDTVSFGGNLLKSTGTNSIFLASFTPAGTHRISKAFPPSSSGSGRGVDVDAAGNIYLTGFYMGSVSFGGGTLTGAGTGDIFIASLTSTGNHRWSKGFGGTSSDHGKDVKVDAASNVYLTGYFWTTVSFGGATFTSKGGPDVFIASFNATSGAHRWSKAYGSTFDDRGYGLAIDSQGNSYLAANFFYTVNFGGGPYISKGKHDVVLVSHNSAGSYRWSRQFGDIGDEYAYGMAISKAGFLALGGAFQNTADFGGGAFTCLGSWDGYVLKYSY